MRSERRKFPNWARATYVLEENFEHAAGLFVDETRDTLDTATAGETADGGLGDTLDVVAKDLAVTLSTTLSETLRNKTSMSHKLVEWLREERTLPPFPRPDIVKVGC